MSYDFNLDFKKWRDFGAMSNRDIQRWLKRVGDTSEKVFKAGMLGNHTGIIYNRRGKLHQASAKGEYPANDTGRMLAGSKSKVGYLRVTFGGEAPYIKYLVASRKMYREALEEAIDIVGRPKGHAKWGVRTVLRNIFRR